MVLHQLSREQKKAFAALMSVAGAQRPLYEVALGARYDGTYPLLEVIDLSVEFPLRHGTLRAVSGISFAISPGEVLGVVGESGAGKSVTGAAVIGLIDPPGRIAGGEIRLGGRRIDNLPYEAMRKIRGREIGAVFQDPLTSLNPLYTIGRQLVDQIMCLKPILAGHRITSPRSAVFRTVSVNELIETYLAKNCSSTDPSRNTPLPSNAVSSSVSKIRNPRAKAIGPGVFTRRTAGSLLKPLTPSTCARIAGSITLA